LESIGIGNIGGLLYHWNYTTINGIFMNELYLYLTGTFRHSTSIGYIFYGYQLSVFEFNAVISYQLPVISYQFYSLPVWKLLIGRLW